jgi:1,2-diacylglycerol 3-beta-galactosyltransferase
MQLWALLLLSSLLSAAANDLAPLIYSNANLPLSPTGHSGKHKIPFGEIVSHKFENLKNAFSSKKQPMIATTSTLNPQPIVNSKSISGLKSPRPAMKGIKDVDLKVVSTRTRRKLLSTLSFFKGGCNNKKKVLILMSDTGGGHRASAQAIDQALQEQFPGRIDVEIMDIWTDHGKYPYNQFVPTYRFLAKHPLLWRGFYAYGTFPPTRKLTEVLSWRKCYQSFRQAIRNANPDFVVSVHPLCQLMPITIVQEMNKERELENKAKIPFVTVVTDLGGAHNTWFDNRADAYYVPSEAVRKLAIRNGVESRKIIMKGLPIRPSFWKESKPKVNVRKSLGIDQNGKTVLLMGGGDGVGGIGSIASTVANKLKSLDFNSQLIVICGHNKKIAEALKEKLQQTQREGEKVKVLIKGFVNNIDEFMAASDCLITKAGPGTIAESMIRGLPLVISSYLPGQVTTA